MSDWYYRKDDKIVGPVSRQELDFLAREGRIRSATEVRLGNVGEWTRYQASNRSGKIVARTGHQATSAIPSSAISPSASAVFQSMTNDTATESPQTDKRTSGPPALTAESDQTRQQAAIGGSLALLLLLLLCFFWSQYSGSSLSGSTSSSVTSGMQRDESRGSGQGEADEDDSAKPSEGRSDVATAAVADVGEEQSQAGQPLDNSGEGDTESASAGQSAEDNAQSTASVDPDDNTTHDDDLATMAMDGQDSIQAGDPMSKFTIAAPGEAVFFGLRATGNRFAFVVDQSGSMSGDRMQRAKQELMNCIYAMPKHVEVFVVFFNGYATPDTAGYRKVDAENLKELQQWVNSIAPNGSTVVIDGMEKVFNVSKLPDSIFLLTDGDFDPSTPEFIKRMNAKGSVRINTVALVSRSGEGLLKKIAADNNGDYKYVP